MSNQRFSGLKTQEVSYQIFSVLIYCPIFKPRWKLNSEALYLILDHFLDEGGNLTASSFSASACQQIHSELLESVNQIYQVVLLIIFQTYVQNKTFPPCSWYFRRMFQNKTIPHHRIWNASLCWRETPSLHPPYHTQSTKFSNSKNISKYLLEWLMIMLTLYIVAQDACSRPFQLGKVQEHWAEK